MIDYKRIQDKFKPQRIYSYKEILRTINSKQSSVASYILQDLLANGFFETKQQGYIAHV